MATKITKGTIEIIQDVPIIKVGDKVGASEATLLNMLKIFPFHYGLVVQKVYDQGSVFSPEILDITDDDIKDKFMAGGANVAAVCLEIGYPTIASSQHRQRYEEPPGHRRRHRDHLQGGRDAQGVPRRPQQVCSCCSCCCCRGCSCSCRS